MDEKLSEESSPSTQRIDDENDDACLPAGNLDEASSPPMKKEEPVQSEDIAKSDLPGEASGKPNKQTRSEQKSDERIDQSPIRDGKWLQMFRQLKEYHAQYGDCNVPRAYPQNPKLGEWCKTQRRAFKKRSEGKSMSMSKERIEKLNELGFDWGTSVATDVPTNRVRPSHEVARDHTDRWQAMLEKLREYRAANGDCLVPTVYRANPDLAKFVYAQRRAHKQSMQGMSNSLTKERLDALHSLDFVFVASRGRKRKHQPKDEDSASTNKQKPKVLNSSSRSAWDAHQEKWQEMFSKLKAYNEEHGNCMVSERDADEMLVVWVKNERKSYSDQLQGKPSSLTKEKIDALLSIGFSWETPAAAGQKQISKKDPKKKKKKKQKTKKPRVKKAKKKTIRKPKETKEDKWMAMLNQLARYKKDFGDCQVPRSYPRLGEWCKTQRRKYKDRMKGESSAAMTNTRIELLERLGFQWSIGVGQSRRTKGTSESAEADVEDADGLEDVDDFIESVFPKADDSFDEPFEEKDKHKEKWYAMFDELKEYKSIHGDCLVPRGYKENPKLAEWCKTQRRAYRERLGTRAMTKDRVDALEELGFSWVGRPVGEKKGHVDANKDIGRKRSSGSNGGAAEKQAGQGTPSSLRKKAVADPIPREIDI